MWNVPHVKTFSDPHLIDSSWILITYVIFDVSVRRKKTEMSYNIYASVFFMVVIADYTEHNLCLCANCTTFDPTTTSIKYYQCLFILIIIYYCLTNNVLKKFFWKIKNYGNDLWWRWMREMNKSVGVVGDLINIRSSSIRISFCIDTCCASFHS